MLLHKGSEFTYWIAKNKMVFYIESFSKDKEFSIQASSMMKIFRFNQKGDCYSRDPGYSLNKEIDQDKNPEYWL